MPLPFFLVWNIRKTASSDLTQAEINSQGQQCRHLLCFLGRSAGAEWTDLSFAFGLIRPDITFLTDIGPIPI